MRNKTDEVLSSLETANPVEATDVVRWARGSQGQQVLNGVMRHDRSTRRVSVVRRRPLVVATSVMLFAAIAAGGWAAFMYDPQTTTHVTCPNYVANAAISGDPIADCAQRWRQEKGTEPPTLVAYVSPNGAQIQVLAPDQTPQPGWTRLSDAFRQDAGLIAVDTELQDVSRGLDSRCFSQTDAAALATSQVQRFGIPGWSVGTEGSPADGASSCAYYYLDQAGKRIVIVSDNTPLASDLPFVVLGHRLTDLLVEGPEAKCLTVEEAVALVRQEAGRVGLEEGDELLINTVPAADSTQLTCAWPTTVAGGRVEVTLRGVPKA